MPSALCPIQHFRYLINADIVRRCPFHPVDGVERVSDFWMDATHTRPLMGALMAGEFLVVGGNGDAYSVEEGRKWLEQSGWRYVEHKPLSGPVTLLIAEAIDSGVPIPSV